MEINLTKTEVKLLLMILEEAQETRADMCCNDPYEDEEKLFSKKERKIMQRDLSPNEPEEEIDGFLFNSQYVDYIIERITEQVNE
jgi:hypothetical protein